MGVSVPVHFIRKDRSEYLFSPEKVSESLLKSFGLQKGPLYPPPFIKQCYAQYKTGELS